MTTGVVQTLPVRQGKGAAGLFLDPPYDMAERDPSLYSHDTPRLAEDVRRWCLKNGDNPRYRIVLAGFEDEGHEELEAHGWRVVEWFKSGYLKGGMGNLGDAEKGEARHQQARERLWLSPHCLRPTTEPDLFDGLEGLPCPS